MPDANDMDLVREFARNHSEAAFTELVRRHLNLVYSVARRCTGSDSDAQDVTQAVFVILARKAPGLRARTVLTGWLYETTRHTAACLQRTNARRHAREQEAYMQSTLTAADTAGAWSRLAPHLEAAMAQLGERDRTLLALRFYENKSGPEAAALLGIREAAAHKRTARALEKLRKFFSRRGVALSATAIAGAVSANSVQVAPAALAKTISAIAMAKGMSAGASTLTLVKGALKIMAWTKAKTAVVTGIVMLLAAGATTITVEVIQKNTTYPWQIDGFDSRVLDRQPPQVLILPSKCHYSSCGTSDRQPGNLKLMGTGVSAEFVVQRAYEFESSVRTVFGVKFPEGKYDYIASLPRENENALREAVRNKFGLIARRETQNTDVLALEVRNPNMAGLKPSRGANPYEGTSVSSRKGQWSCQNAQLSKLGEYLEDYLGIPVVDKTGLTNCFDIVLKLNASDFQHPDLQNMRQVLLDQLGLELVETNLSIEKLIVEKVK